MMLQYCNSDIIDTGKKGYITYVQAQHFLKKSKRNLQVSVSEIKDEVSKIFAMVDTDHSKVALAQPSYAEINCKTQNTENICGRVYCCLHKCVLPAKASNAGYQPGSEEIIRQVFFNTIYFAF